MSMLKNKKLGLWLALFTVVLSLALATILSAVAQNEELLNTYYKVNVSVNDETYGSVEITEGVRDAEGNFRYGTDVVLTAIPKDSGYVFKRWEGSSMSTSNPLSITITGNCSYKAVFEPVVYNITYENSSNLHYASGTTVPVTHTHGKLTLLPTPMDTPGYTFDGWYAESEGKTPQKYNKGDSLGPNEYQADIKLTPIFTENEYDVTCYDVIESLGGDVLGTVVKKYQYKKDTISFDFWGERDLYDGYTYHSYVDLSEPVRVNTQYNKVYRIYKANQYTVYLDKSAADAQSGDTSVKVTYNQPFPSIPNEPQRAGYTFMGYFLDANGNGKLDYGEKMYCSYNRQTGAWSYEVWDIAGERTLVALWEKNNYTLSFSESLSNYFAEVIVQDKLGTNYLNREIPYNTELVITVRVQDGYKLVEWMGDSSIRHASYGTFEYTILGDSTLDGLILPEIETPQFKVDYFNECFVYDGTIPSGIYRLEDTNQNLILKFSVDTNGTVSFIHGNSLSVSDLLGKTVYMIRGGDGTETSDSVPKILAIAARPAKVQFDRNKVYPVNENQTTIRIVFPEGTDLSGWEFACSTDANNLVWQDTCVFTGLRNGTPYHVYVRVAATADAPHGEVEYVGQATTDYDRYVQDQIDKIIDWKHEGIVGDNVDALVSAAVKELRDLQASATFYDDANAIVKRVEELLAHARVQDQAVADLTAKYNELIASGKYADNLGMTALKTLFDGAKESVAAATTGPQVDAILTETLKGFDLVPVSYLYVNEDMRLYAEKGMDKDYRLAMSRIVDLASISAKIQRAVNRGTIVPVGLSMTYSELQSALKTMDVLGYYQMRLSYASDATIRTTAQGPYQMRLLLPEDLRDDSGFMVAYYNSVTEEMTVLETTREGNYLIFTAPQSVEDFVIMGDHAVNMIPVFAGLMVLFLTQIVALAMISGSRRRVRRGMSLNGFALPVVALTIRFFPLPIANAVLALAVLVILMQIILTVLLVKLDLIPRGRRLRFVERAPQDAQEAQEVPPVAPEVTPVAPEEPITTAEEYAEESYEIEEEPEIETEELPAIDEAFEAMEEVEAEAEENVDASAQVEDVPSYALAEDWFEDEDEAPAYDGEEVSGYSMQYDEDTNGYSLEYDNEEVAYTDEEFDNVGEGFVEYDDGSVYEYAEDAEVAEGYEQAYEEEVYEDAGEAVYEDAYEEVYADTNEVVYEDAYEELPDYGYDQVYGEDDTEVVYDYVTAEDVIRDEDYVPEDGMEEEETEVEFFEL